MKAAKILVVSWIGFNINIYSTNLAIIRCPIKWNVFLSGCNLHHMQRRNDAPATPAYAGGAVIRGHQIVIKIWDNFVCGFVTRVKRQGLGGTFVLNSHH